MPSQLHLEDIRRAWESRDPELARFVETLATQTDKEPETPVREGAPTFEKFLAEIRSPSFRRKPKDEQERYRVEQMKLLEAADAEVPLPQRLRLHEIITQLWESDDPFARSCLLKIIARVRLTYGPWRALKRIFKEAEAKGDTEIFGALAARFDMALAGGDHDVSARTLAYLCRRGWRYLRKLGVALPACYPDAAVDVLACYTDETSEHKSSVFLELEDVRRALAISSFNVASFTAWAIWNNTWIANHIFHHESHDYRRYRFSVHSQSADILKNRAFGDLWKRTPRPLFSLLERARSDMARDFAVKALQSDFRAVLREVEPSWVARLVGVGSKVIDEFVVWILNNVPRFEQAAFRSLGLHNAVLRLFDSPSPAAQAYAAEYARTHARDLPVTELVRLVNNSHETVRKLACDLLQSRDPRREVGLDSWGMLLETAHGNNLAAAVLRKHFGAAELTPAWFRDRLFSPSEAAFQFARGHLPHIHPPASLGASFFCDLVDRLDDPADEAVQRVAKFALAELVRFDLNALEPDFLRRLFVHPLTSMQVGAWIDEGRLKVQSLPAAFFKMLAFHLDWEADAWVADLKQSGRTWTRSLEFDEPLSNRVLGWLGDVRRFTAADLGFDWLMQLVARGEPRYHDFAVETMIKVFLPADFAPGSASPKREQGSSFGDGLLARSASEGVASAGEAQEMPGTPPAPAQPFFAGASFVFTGKMATMKRQDAETKVKEASGSVATGVTKKLHYLVIGDEGSPLYDQGNKGNKQIKAEELNAEGANIRIISETAFLKMLAGESSTVSADATLAGCARLWQMVIAPGPADAPVARFAMQYIRRHHPDICQAETDRPVDPGADIPATFLTFDLVKPLFSESRKPLRDFALELAKWEFARWAPPTEEIVHLSELPHDEVRAFVAQSLLADNAPEHRRYRLDPNKLSPVAACSFCESTNEQTRLLGLELLHRSPRLRVPEELFRLTESPDRKVRAFVIRSFWSLYHDRGVTEDWKPRVQIQSTVGLKKPPKEADRGEGVPHRPEQPPAGGPTLSDFLRRILFEIPPARLEPSKSDGAEGITMRLRPLPHRRAKIELVETMRDLALEDAGFARGIMPLLEEFMTSRGDSERAACLVAVTRIKKRHGNNQSWAGR